MSGRSTPSQTVGPFFSIGFAWLERADLTEGASGEAKVTIRGRVLDGDEKPVPDCGVGDLASGCGWPVRA